MAPIEYLSAYEDTHKYREIQVPPTATVPFTPLPPSPSPDAKCSVHMVKNSDLTMSLSVFVRTSDTKAPIVLPVYTFVVEVSHPLQRHVVCLSRADKAALIWPSHRL